MLNHNSNFVSRICPELPDFERAIQLLIYQQNVSIIQNWLTSSKTDLRSLNKLGIGVKLDNDDSALFAFTAIVRMVNEHPEKQRIAWLLDESQRIIDLRPTSRNRIQTGLESLFNRCPHSLSIILAYSGRQPQKIERILSGALISRRGSSYGVSISPIEAGDAKTFVEQLFSSFRLEGYTGDPFFPFSTQAIDRVIRTIQDEKWYMKPRNLMNLLDRITSDYEIAILDNDLAVIGVNEVDSTIQEIKQSAESIASFKRIE
jgi:hypothetical protein